MGSADVACKGDADCDDKNSLKCADFITTNTTGQFSGGAKCVDGAKCGTNDTTDATLFYGCDGLEGFDCTSATATGMDKRNNTLCDSLGGFQCAAWTKDDAIQKYGCVAGDDC